MWAGLGILLVLISVSIAAFRLMIDVKPSRIASAVRPGSSRELDALQERLMGHVRVLGDAIGERHLDRPQALRAAADYIRRIWTSAGLSVSEEPFEVGGQEAVNLFVEQKGSARPEVVVVVGAHYDSAPGTPGANDNGTGVALLLEMARDLGRESFSKTIRYVAFANEEPPHYFTEGMGSRVHARRAHRQGQNIWAMISLETVGYYSSAPRTQQYPFPFGFFYPHTGNFLAVVGNLRSRPLVVEFLAHFMATSDFPVEGAATFEWIPGISWSDHWSFWKEGYRAIMLTDTAPFRYPEYHGRHDLPNRINPSQFARAAYGITQAVRALASAPERVR